MKNNIIKDDQEISMKAASLSENIADHTESVTTNHNLATDPCETNNEILTDVGDSIEPMPIADQPIVDPAVASQSTQTEITAFFNNAKSTVTELFDNNRQLFITLGWIVLVIFGAKVVFATLGIIDDIPLVTPIIKLVGLVSVVRFAWRYLIREHDRQELIAIIDRTKLEVLGDRN
jgi:CAAD domains of cyanobacterial aminoacyl-tRNA synthetase